MKNILATSDTPHRFAGLSPTALVVAGSMLASTLWGAWATREIVALERREVVTVQLSRIMGDFVEAEARSGRPAEETQARVAAYLKAEPADVMITGVQAPDDLVGQLAPMVAARLGMAHVSVVVSVESAGGKLIARQEFSGGRSHKLEVATPVVILVLSLLGGRRSRGPRGMLVPTDTGDIIDGSLRELHERSRTSGGRVHIHEVEEALRRRQRGS